MEHFPVAGQNYSTSAGGLARTSGEWLGKPLETDSSQKEQQTSLPELSYLGGPQQSPSQNSGIGTVGRGNYPSCPSFTL